MKKTALLLAACLLLAMSLPAAAQLKIDTAMSENGLNRIVSMIMANPADGGAALTEAEDTQQMQALVDANMLIQMRFPLAQYQIAMGRAGDGRVECGIEQTLRLYQDENTASIAVLWQGEQADGTIGSSVQSLALDLTSGKEVTFDQLFADPDGAAAQMEAIIERDVMSSMSDYMEFGDLLPMPRDSFSYDENGLTVYYPQERYLTFSGRGGAVHFAWHEIDHLIGEGGPLYAISRPAPADMTALADCIAHGALPAAMPYFLGDRLGDALDTLTLAADPDYTRESLVYQFEEEALRGWALEIPKYAETDEADTPISAVRTSRIGLFGLVTGETTREQASALLGEAEQTRVYDAGDAMDMMLVPGESLLYSLGGHVLQLHFDESGLLSTLIIRAQMPQDLF